MDVVTLTSGAADGVFGSMEMADVGDGIVSLTDGMGSGCAVAASSALDDDCRGDGCSNDSSSSSVHSDCLLTLLLDVGLAAESEKRRGSESLNGGTVTVV